MSLSVRMPRILISGAGIAGPVLAWWLSRAGWSCTIVERDATPRLTGQQIDVRGAGLTIIQRMGLEDAIRRTTVKEKGLRFVDASGKNRASFPAAAEGGSSKGFTSEIEILRGELAAVLMKAAEEETNVQIVYGDKIVGLQESTNGVDVTFKTGAAWGGDTTQTFDVVVAADGMHSSTRKLMFPKLDRLPFKSLDQYMAYFTIPMDATTDSDMWASWLNAPGGLCVLLRPDVDRNRAGACIAACSNADARGLFSKYFALPPDEQKRAWKSLFAEAAKESPLVARVISGMDTSKAHDFYMQEIAQVKCDAWTRGRMALLGDAAACPSPITGMGTTVAIEGAYHLALELVKRPKDHAAGLRAYEAVMRPIVKKAQSLPPGAPQLANPQTRWGIIVLYSLASFVSRSGILNWFGGGAAPEVAVPEWPASTST